MLLFKGKVQNTVIEIGYNWIGPKNFMVSFFEILWRFEIFHFERFDAEWVILKTFDRKSKLIYSKPFTVFQHWLIRARPRI